MKPHIQELCRVLGEGEPRLCRIYRVQTKGKVESAVRHLEHNFLPGREFVDVVDLTERLLDWNATVADVRFHGTTHERPIDRLQGKQAHLVPSAGQPSFAHEGRRSRIVASNYLARFKSNRYSVPFHLIGQTVEVQACSRRAAADLSPRSARCRASAAAGPLPAAHPARARPGCQCP